MAHYAKIVDGRVENVVVADADWVAAQTDDMYVLSTDENTACIDGFLIDDIFVNPQPYPSWTLGSDYHWHAPISLPSDASTVIYRWEESSLSWVQVASI